MKKLSDLLWAENQDLARACLSSKFIQGLALGDLPRDAFKNYIAQDAFFLEAFARGYGMALAVAPDRVGLQAFTELLAGVTTELELHASYAKRWNVDLAGVEPSPATLAYTEFLRTTAGACAVAEICASMAPCMRLYAWLGQALAKTSLKTAGDYAEWIKAYSSPDFAALAARLESLLNRYAADKPSVHDRYRRAMELELGFFDAHARQSVAV
jgi:thiaminase/transcriptional activator TenA